VSAPRPSVSDVRQRLAQLKGTRLRDYAATLADDERAGVRDAVQAALSRDRARAREADRLRRLYRLELELAGSGCAVVAGVDEVGRGALAGPLTAGACVLPPRPRIVGLNDSKKLTPSARERLAEEIRCTSTSWSVAHVSADQVDALGMTAALRRVMCLALDGLSAAPDHVVVDGHPMRLCESETSVVKGDAKVAAIAAASIVAKVARDALMIELAETYPAYGFDVNKGYGTAEHLRAIAEQGPSSVHRRSFIPGAGTGRLL
jgi:ribonuclease HII